MDESASLLCLPGGEAYADPQRYPVIPFNRKALAEFAATYYQEPSKSLKLIGVTGTNGKSSVVYYLRQLLEAMGEKVLSVGTLTHPLTTPESWDLQAIFADHLKKGGTYAVMEVSSIGIDQGRVLQMDFDIKCFTNISQDHLDYHKSFDAYKKAKWDFMQHYPGKALWPEDFENITLTYEAPCRFQATNLKAALAVLNTLGFEASQLNKILPNLKHPPGRFEYVNCGQSFDVVVDYAHTPDGLAVVLEEAKQISREKGGQLWTVFGCGGDRDKGKRPLMAAVAEKWADQVILSSDNPRSEDPQKIIEDMVKGLKCPEKAVLEADRKAAIAYALKNIGSQDLLLIAGKGHEKVQVISGQRIPFDDVQVAADLLKEIYGL